MSLSQPRSLLLLMTLLGAATVAAAKDIYVSTGGNNNNSGSSAAAPLRTIAAASAVAAAGDNIHLMTGQYNESIVPVASGTAAQPITYSSFGSGPAVIGNVNVGILVSSQAYIVFDGINVNGANPPPNATVNTFAVIQNSHNIVISHAAFRNANGWAGIDVSALYSPDGRYYAGVPKSSMVQGATSYVTIEDNVLDSVGTYAAVYGDVIQVGAGTQHILIQRNTITHGGHDLVEFDSDYGVLQSNTLNNSFADLVGGDTGYRSIEVQGSFNVIQGNLMEHARQGGQARVPPLASVRGTQNIVRHNIFFDGIADGNSTWCSDAQTPVTTARIYNNTMYRLGAAALAVWAYTGCGGLGNLAFVNNLVVQSRMTPGPLSWSNRVGPLPDVDLFFSVSGGAGVADVGLGPLAQSVVRGNLFAPSNGGPAYVQTGADGRIPLSTASGEYPQLVAGNTAGRVTFIKAQPSAAADFQLQAGSAGIGAGVFLTNVVGSGTSSRLTVQDSLYFSDGNGLIAGDAVQLQGSGQILKVLSIDRGANTLTLSSPVTFRDKQGISLPYNGSAPDVGTAGSGVASVVPMPPSGVSIH
ncbi:MAG TPA: DUF1565 domain-containing protein [Steroidobacteraceae bacterium]|jgi:hypothetical protein|nr:DUF1565 domain-containing protein [Steroidobacteraceae bacterium]